MENGKSTIDDFITKLDHESFDVFSTIMDIKKDSNVNIGELESKIKELSHSLKNIDNAINHTFLDEGSINELKKKRNKLATLLLVMCLLALCLFYITFRFLPLLAIFNMAIIVKQLQERVKAIEEINDTINGKDNKSKDTYVEEKLKIIRRTLENAQNILNSKRLLLENTNTPIINDYYQDYTDEKEMKLILK